MTGPDGNNEQNDPNADVDLSQLALDEIRLRYQEESDRRTAVEAKIGTVLTVDAIIVSIIGIFSNLTLLLLGAMGVAIFSVINGILALRLRDYHTPGKDEDDYLQYIDNPPEQIRRELVKSYLTSIVGNEETDDPELFFKGNRTKNDEKYKKLNQCLRLTGLSLFLVLLHSILSIC
ncbi:hypothetical protein [Salinigranum halophilum]|uniref:hypothetical protein n=1 Tax=Salinigranum halophilum TaxID=2565931 RepID=UPI00115F461B|nr:hypothetical protein [Salinigranum halophilum]